MLRPRIQAVQWGRARSITGSWREAAHLLVVLKLIMRQLETNDELIFVGPFAVLEIDDRRSHLIVENCRLLARPEAEIDPDVALGQNLSVKGDGHKIGPAIAGR